MAVLSNRDGVGKQYVQNALRVSQLDASELDFELFELFKAEIKNVFKYFRSNFLIGFNPEINAALRYLLWHYSVRSAESTLGQKLLDLRYVNDDAGGQQGIWMTRKQKVLFAVATIGVPWLEERTDDLENATDGIPFIKRVWPVLRFLSKVYKVAALVNFLVFLCLGKRQFLTEHLLGITPVFQRPRGFRQVGFDMMNRELLWHGFAEFLFFALPLINFRRIKNFCTKHLLARSPQSAEAERTPADYKECVVCGEWPFNPHQFGCRHVFCYYCIQSNYKADPKFACPVCQTSVSDADAIVPVPVQSTTISSPNS